MYGKTSKPNRLRPHILSRAGRVPFDESVELAVRPLVLGLRDEADLDLHVPVDRHTAQVWEAEQ